MEMDMNEVLDNISSACGPDGALDRIATALEKIAAILDETRAPENQHHYAHFRVRDQREL